MEHITWKSLQLIHVYKEITVGLSSGRGILIHILDSAAKQQTAKHPNQKQSQVGMIVTIGWDLSCIFYV